MKCENSPRLKNGSRNQHKEKLILTNFEAPKPVPKDPDLLKSIQYDLTELFENIDKVDFAEPFMNFGKMREGSI